MGIHNFNYFEIFDQLFKERRLAKRSTPAKKDAEATEKAEAKAKEELRKTDKADEVKVESKRKRKTHEKEVKQEEVEKRVRKSMDNLKGVWKLNLDHNRKRMKLDPASLKISNEAELHKTVEAFKDLGLPARDVNWMGGQLSLAFDKKAGHDVYDRALLQNPDKPGNLEKIAKEYPPLFYLALEYYRTVKGILEVQRSGHVQLKENRQKMDEDPLFTKAFDTLKGAGNRLQEAYNEGDWATVGMYAAGFYAFYKLYKKYADKNSKIKDALIWGTAIYCGVNIFAPDVAKKVFGGGRHADVKGTALEKLQGMGIATEMKEMMISVQLAPARVKDVYNALGTDHASAEHEMIQLNAPGIAQYFPGLSHLGPLLPGQKDQFSTEEKLYIETGRALYRNALGFQAAWTKHVQPDDPSWTFDKVFLSDTGPDYAMSSLYASLRDYGSNAIDMPWSAPLRDRAAGDLESIFGEEDVWVEREGSQNHLDIKVRGCPMVVRVSTTTTKPRRREYQFLLPNEAEAGMDSNLKIIANDKRSEGAGRDSVYAKIQHRMDTLLNYLKVSDPTAPRKVKYNTLNGRWEATIAISGSGEYETKATPRKFVVTPYEDFSGLHGDAGKGGGYVEISEKIAKESHVATSVLYDVMNSKEFKPLGVFWGTQQVDFYDYPEEDGTFQLTFAHNKDLTIDFLYKDGVYTTPGTQELANVLGSTEFKDAYVEARAEGKDFGVFNDMAEFVESNMNQEYHIYIWQGMAHWFTGASLDAPIDGLSTEFMSGSIPDYYTQTLITAKKAQLLGILRHRLENADTMEELRQAEVEVRGRLDKVEAVYNAIMRKEKPGGGKAWARNEFMEKIIEPIKDAGLVSYRYKGIFKRCESRIFQEIARSGSDVKPNMHIIAGKVLAAFANKTSHLDDPLMDDLEDGGLLPEEVRLRDNYCQWAEDRVMEKATFFMNKYGALPQNIPVAHSTQWEIPSYDEWLLDDGLRTAHALDPMEMKERLRHDPTSGGSLSPLEKEIKAAYKDVLDEIKTEVSRSKIPNETALNDLWLGYKDNPGYAGTEDPLGNPDRIRQDANEIHAIYKTYKEQMQAIESLKIKLKYFLRDPNNEKEFWIGIPWTDQMKILGADSWEKIKNL